MVWSFRFPNQCFNRIGMAEFIIIFQSFKINIHSAKLIESVNFHIIPRESCFRPDQGDG